MSRQSNVFIVFPSCRYTCLVAEVGLTAFGGVIPGGGESVLGPSLIFG